MTKDTHPELTRPSAARRLHFHTIDSEAYHKLRDGPKLASELSDRGDTISFGPSKSGNGLRSMIRKLRVPRISCAGSTTKRPRDNRIVYYLYGDERRAMRKFIEVNTEFIESCMANENGTVLSQSWPEGKLQMLAEEWEYYRRHG